MGDSHQADLSIVSMFLDEIRDGHLECLRSTQFGREELKPGLIDPDADATLAWEQLVARSPESSQFPGHLLTVAQCPLCGADSLWRAQLQGPRSSGKVHSPQQPLQQITGRR